jgi:hypothetical protein
VININAKIQLNANKKTSLKHPRNNRKQKRRSRESNNNNNKKRDKTATFIADYIKKTDCNLKELPKLFKLARNEDLKISKSAVMQEYKTCLVEKAKAKAAEKSKDNAKDVEEDQELLTLFEDNMKTWDKTHWREKPNVYSSIVENVKGLDGKTNYMHFVRNGKKGKSIDYSGRRILTSWPIDASNGGLMSFDLKFGEENGENGCYESHVEIVKQEEAKKRREEQRTKYENRRKAETNRRNQCYNKPPCNGNGRGIYRSKYIKMPGWKSYWSAESSCTCKCNSGWVGANCKTYMATSQCQSVGDPHPLSLDGLRYNMYDAGEFLMFKHPESPVEIHILTRMAHPRISATAGIAVKRGNTILSIEQPHCGNGNNFQVRATVNGRCQNIGWGRRWGWKDGLYYNGGRYIYMRGVGNIYVGGWWRYGWWRGQCGSAYWLNLYIRIRSPRDGKAQGLCGTFRGNRNTDENYLIQKQGHRHHHQIARKTRDENTIAAKDSFFTCGAWKPGFRYSPYFKSLRSRASAGAMKSRLENAAMMDAEQSLSREFAKDKLFNKRTLGDDEKTAMSKERAIAICKTKKEIVTEEALSNCVNDLMTTGDTKVEKVAAQESEEEQEEAAENLKEDTKEEEEELVVAEKLKVPDKYDPVLQYCYGEKCHTKWGEFNESNWKQWKAYPEKVYGTYLDKWRRVTARIPDEAKNKKFMFRFMQANHTCYCCNDFYVSNVKVQTGGMPIAIVAEQEFELYGDGELLGHGEWFEPAKDTLRFRAPLGLATFAIKAKGGKNGRSGILGMFGKELVTSSSWKCSVEQDGQGTWMKADFDDSKWPTAVEEGQNGILPWGVRPGISKKAFWIFSHDTYNMRGQQVYCRVNVKKAIHSDSIEEDMSSRWSCKEGENRGAPKSIQLNSDMMSSVEIKSGNEKGEHFSPSSAITASKEKSDSSETRILMQINTEKFMSQTVEGQMLKNAMLRLFVLDDTKDDLLVCKLIRPWKAGDVTWLTAPAFDGPASNCIKMENKLVTKGQWVDIDLTVWMREWITSPEQNYGVMIMPTGYDGVGFVSYLDPDANQRPRLSLSCHGDNFNIDHAKSNKFAFKEMKGSLIKEKAKGKGSKKTCSSKIIKNT